MITPQEIRYAEHIIDTSNAVGILTAALRRDRRGRKSNPDNLRLLLLGTFLAIRDKRSASVADIHRTLTRALPADEQVRLGVRRRVVNAEGHAVVQVLERHHLYQLTKTITARLSYGADSAPDISDTERALRRRTVAELCDAVMDVFDLGWSSTTYAMDATGVWSWAIGRGKKGADTDPITGDAAPTETPPPGDEPPSSVAAAAPFDRDAAWGYKTAKTKGEEIFFGYHEHTLVQVPHGDDNADCEPRLIRRFALTPANTDVCDVSLELIDRLGRPVTDLLVDAHYHYKAVQRWKDELTRRGIRQHHDLRINEQGFTEFARMRWAAGWAHCPATPDHHGVIPRPAPNDTDAAMAAFKGRVDDRERYTLRFVNRPDDTGTQRLQCPALAGKVGCPLRPHTVAAAISEGLPVIAEPPPAEDGHLPTCCTQQTVKVTAPDPIRKLQQPHYWGSAPWEKEWKKRTYVEGSYGNRKNPSTENLRRGLFRTVGLPWLHIVMAMVNASYNLRMLQNWHHRTSAGDSTHPLLQRGEPHHGFVLLTKDQADALAAQHPGDEAA